VRRDELVGGQPAVDDVDQLLVAHGDRRRGVHRRGAFESGGTTDVVQEVTGRPAEDLATIARRYAAADPMTRRTLPNLLRAMVRMAKILLTRPVDLDGWRRHSGVPAIDGVDCVDTPEWIGTHDVPNAFGATAHLRSVSGLELAQ